MNDEARKRLEILQGLDNAALDASSTRDVILKAPFGYPGGKTRLAKYILPHLPITDRYCEPFGGSFALGLARPPVKLEVYNDRYGGVVDFYRCLRDRYDDLIKRLEYTLHAREEFVLAKEWEDVTDPVERAARWYTMTQQSFSSLGRNWGRQTQVSTASLGSSFHNALGDFHSIHERFKRVQIENLDWRRCLRDYDHPDMVFYLDPPYIDAYTCYKHHMREDEHRALADAIFQLKGFVALSGYATPLYDALPWYERFEFDAHVSMKSVGATQGNNKEHIDSTRHRATEVLWIKRANPIAEGYHG